VVNCAICGGTGYTLKPARVNGKPETVAFIRIKCPACSGISKLQDQNVGAGAAVDEK